MGKLKSAGHFFPHWLRRMVRSTWTHVELDPEDVGPYGGAEADGGVLNPYSIKLVPNFFK